jgi:hypothetical protein
MAECYTFPPVRVVHSDGVDEGFGVRNGAPCDLVGYPEPAQILDHEDEIVALLVERGKVRTRWPQRVG